MANFFAAVLVAGVPSGLLAHGWYGKGKDGGHNYAPGAGYRGPLTLWLQISMIAVGRFRHEETERSTTVDVRNDAPVEKTV